MQFTKLLRRGVSRLRRTRLELDTLYTVFRDVRRGGYCGGRTRSAFADHGACDVMSSEYSALDEIFSRSTTRIKPTDVLVDVGCGKGRVINYWLDCGLQNRIVGVEADSGIALRTQARLKDDPQVEIRVGDIRTLFPTHGSLFYVYNSFSRAVMTDFKQLIEDSCKAPIIRLVYYNCYHADLFSNSDCWRLMDSFVIGDLNVAVFEYGVVRP